MCVRCARGRCERVRALAADLRLQARHLSVSQAGLPVRRVRMRRAGRTGQPAVPPQRRRLCATRVAAHGRWPPAGRWPRGGRAAGAADQAHEQLDGTDERDRLPGGHDDAKRAVVQYIRLPIPGPLPLVPAALKTAGCHSITLSRGLPDHVMGEGFTPAGGEGTGTQDGHFSDWR